METLKNNFAAIATISACIGGILIAFGNFWNHTYMLNFKLTSYSHNQIFF